MDYLLPHFTPESFHCKEGETSRRRTALLVLAVTLHNIPEGMAVGHLLCFGRPQWRSLPPTRCYRPRHGNCIQNFPEGAAISLPLHQEGMGRGKAFLIGAASRRGGAYLRPAHCTGCRGDPAAAPWLLSFAAGAMLYVVVEELIPEANLTEGGHTGTLGVMAGFLIMMILDVALG